MMNATSQQPLNPKAAGITIGVHLLLLLLFALFKYAPPMLTSNHDDLGIEVNIGTSDDGFGDDQGLEPGDPAPAQAAMPKSVAAPTPTRSEVTHAKDIMESNESDAPTIKKTTTPKEKKAPIVEHTKVVKTKQQSNNNTTTTPTRQQNTTNNSVASNATPAPKPKYTMDGATGSGGNGATTSRAGGSQGDGTGNGDKGVVGGTDGASNYSGTPGRGNVGVGHTIQDRKIVNFPDKEAEFKESGSVVIRVTVDKDGKIIAKSIKSSPSATLSKIAMAKLNQVKFNKSENAPVEQFGNITFVFKSR